MRIGELAKTFRVSVQTLHFYERKGLLPAPRRSRNGYRAYSLEHFERLAFIRHCRTLDMALDEIARLLQLRERPAEKCVDARSLVDRRLDQVRQRVASLQVLERHLADLQERCPGHGDAEHCGILTDLAFVAHEEALACAVPPLSLSP